MIFYSVETSFFLLYWLHIYIVSLSLGLLTSWRQVFLALHPGTGVLITFWTLVDCHLNNKAHVISIDVINRFLMHFCQYLDFWTCSFKVLELSSCFRYMDIFTCFPQIFYLFLLFSCLFLIKILIGNRYSLCGLFNLLRGGNSKVWGGEHSWREGSVDLRKYLIYLYNHIT